ncbi:hypothetical protein GS597_08000 [Synechococcales cyanobacterium C]|uniref:Uncharacterized protein n=1 Tax=Petrachloros mirabilis ULC683 TaxID=2781853 RepID=A0A8K1ZX12_9CYAN|nr:hypothetical protein [Petrachloros mirabilis]NCJ06453.1 hypothetical protein [Petrachloros mirabilis ULC683]
MTSTAPDRLDRIEFAMEQIVTKIDNLADDVAAIKSDVAAVKSELAEVKSDVAVIKADMLEVKFAQVRFDENLKAVETQMVDLKNQNKTQDARTWGILITLTFVLLGSLIKMAFFPGQGL